MFVIGGCIAVIATVLAGFTMAGGQVGALLHASDEAEITFLRSVMSAIVWLSAGESAREVIMRAGSSVRRVGRA